MPVPGALRCTITNHTTFYDYRVMNGPCADLVNATLLHLLEDVRVDHDKSCRCGIEVQARAWKACIKTEDAVNTLNLDTSQLKACPLDTHLSEFSDLVENTCAVLHVFFEGRPRKNLKPGPYASSAIFSHFQSTVRRFAGASSRLPTDADVAYNILSHVPGMLIVDKSKFILPRYSLEEPGRLPVLRRPKGFGKTTFLSMMETYFDVHQGSLCGWFRSVNDPGMPLLWSQYCRNRSSLVCHLDLSGLVVSVDKTEESLRSICRDFLNAAARDCFRQYCDLLKYPEFPFDCDDDDIMLDSDSPMTDFENMADAEIEKMKQQITFEQLLRLVSAQRYSISRALFVGVDNYTAPLMSTGKSPLLELVITTEIFEPIIGGLRKGSVIRALMVGDSDLPGEPFMPYCVSPLFYEYLSDLTADDAMHGALGLTESALMALGHALYNDKDLLLRRVREHVGLGIPAYDSYGIIFSPLTYSFRDVFAFCRAIGANGTGDVPSSLRIATVDDEDYVRIDLLEALPDEIRYASSLARAAKDKLSEERKRKERDDDQEALDEGRDGPPMRSASIERWLSGLPLRVDGSVPPSPSTTSSSPSAETKVDEERHGRKPCASESMSKATSLESTFPVDTPDGRLPTLSPPPPSPSTSPPARTSTPLLTSLPSSVKRQKLVQ